MIDNIMTLEEIEEGLKDKKLYVISTIIDVSYPTLKKLQNGDKGNYTYNVLKSVSDYLRK